MRSMPTASQSSLNPNDNPGLRKKRFDTQNLHILHHNAVLPDRLLQQAMSPTREGATKSPYHDPYGNLPTKPNKVQPRELSNQLRQAELAGINGAAGMLTDLRRSHPRENRQAN